MLYTSQGFMQLLNNHLTELDLMSGELSVKTSIEAPFLSADNKESEANTAILQKNILEAAACDTSVLEARKKVVDIHKVEQSIQETAKIWAEAAGELALLKMAKDLQMAAVKPVSTNCVWTDEPTTTSSELLRKTISNNVFSSTVSITGLTEYDPQADKNDWTLTWHAKWMLATNHNTIHTVIKKVHRRFTDLEKAKGYIQTQMDRLSKDYFYSMDPVIPMDMREYFLVHGIEIPGMTYEKA